MAINRPALRWVLALAAALAASGCGDGATGPGAPGPSLDLAAVFAPATAAEIAAVEADWAARSPVAADVASQGSLTLDLGPVEADARVFAHRVDGYVHYGVVVVPRVEPGRRLPVLLFAHPGDGGVGTTELALAVGLMGDAVGDFVYVVPSFRSEALRLGFVTLQSGGPASPWDRDVDDAMALLDVALREVPEADGERVGAVGISRGGGVALLAAARDPRIDVVAELAGPTDFLGDDVRGRVEAALDGAPADVPGFDVLDERFIQPLGAGALSVEAFRSELVRRSSVLFADRLPPVQIHHGTADTVVSVEHARALADALDAVPGREGDALYLYPDAGHDPLAFTGARERVVAWLLDHLAAPAATP